MSTDRDIALGFLTRVLPADGVYSLRYRTGKTFMKKEFASSISELWDKMSANGDVDCFYSTATFKDATSPDAANVYAKRAFYLDLDGYKTQTEAIKAVVEFCQAVGLPWPGFVLSGHGVHAYWPLDADISPAAWLPYASGLKLACKEKELKADGAVTADPARILRCPGTFNCKKEPKTEVTIHDVFFTLGPYSLDEFAPLLSYAPEVKGLPATAPEAHFEGSAAVTDQTVAYYSSALYALSPEDRDVWARMGMAVFELGWGDMGFNMWDAWSKQSDKYDEEGQKKLWAGFPKYRETHLDNLVTAGSLVHLAEEAGWVAPVGTAPALPPTAPFVPPPELVAKAEAGDRYELHCARVLAQGALMAGKDGSGYAENKWRNATWALVKLGVRGRWDEFSNNSEIKFPGRPWEQISSRTDSDARRMIMEICGGSDQGKHAVEQALDELCGNVGRYHPIREHLEQIAKVGWDGTPRLDKWLIDYCHARDTPLNRFYGAAVIVAAVRRALTEKIIRFDHMLVLEGGTGIGKSSVVEILGRGAAPEGWYKNQEINWLDPRSSVEALRGAWFYEWPELKGHGKQAENHIKSCLSSPIDSIRMAYDRRVTSSPRRAILIATTNYGSEYLTDQTGNRRYWVVDCGVNKFRLDELRRDRDQLFAEAMLREREMGAYLDTPEELAEAEKAELEPRTTVPHLADFISPLTSSDVEFLTMHDIKTSTWMANQGSARNQDIADALRWLGWEQDKYNNYKLPNGERTRRWRRVIT